MLEPSIYVELAIYSYFALVAVTGCVLYGRLWIASRDQSGSERQFDAHEDDGTQLDG